MTYLLDANVLIALAWPQHIHHEAAHRWFKNAGSKSWATCAITQLAFVRISSNAAIIADAVTPSLAVAALSEITNLTGHCFWSECLPMAQIDEVSHLAVVGHRQVTDTYLLAMARHHSGVLATFDRGVKQLAGSMKTKALQTPVELLEAK